MISENAIHVRGEASRQIDQQMAEYLAAGGAIQVLPAPTFAPKPVQEVRYCLPKPPVRRRKPEPKPVAPAPLPSPAREELGLSTVQAFRKERNERVAETAKTMTSAQVSERTGIPLRTLADIAKRNGFSFVNTWSTFAIDEEADAERIRTIERYKRIGMSRSQCAQALCISQTMLRRLLKVSGIDYPKIVGGRR